MKVLIISHAAVKATNQELYARLAATTDWEVVLAVPATWKDEYGQVVRATRSPEFEGSVIPLPVLLNGSIPLHAYRIHVSKLLRREAPDALYVSHEPYGVATFQFFWAARRLGALPLGFYSSQNIEKSYPLPFGAAESYVYRNASFAVTVSETVAGVLRRKGFGGPIKIVPFGVNAGAGPAPEPKAVERSDKPFTIGYVGRLVLEKGVDTLIEAVGGLLQQPIRVIVVGEGPERAQLVRRANDLGLRDRVEWLGYMSPAATRELYSRFDVTVIPSRTAESWKEQFGRTVLESLAHGTPVITSDSGELPKLVAQTGGGWTFPEEDEAFLRSLILQALDLPAEVRARGKRGQEAVIRDFDVDTLARKLADAFTSAATTERSG